MNPTPVHSTRQVEDEHELRLRQQADHVARRAIELCEEALYLTRLIDGATPPPPGHVVVKARDLPYQPIDRELVRVWLDDQWSAPVAAALAHPNGADRVQVWFGDNTDPVTFDRNDKLAVDIGIGF